MCFHATTATALTPAELIQAAGTAESDRACLEHLRALTEHPDADERLRTDATRLVTEVDRYVNDPDLAYFSRAILDHDTWDFSIAADSPLFPLAEWYNARMRVWATLEFGGYWSDPVERRKRFDKIRPRLEFVRDAFPDNRIVRMYLGEPLPPDKQYPAVPGAPDWAVHQREALERLADIIEWWIDHRMQDNGEYGGGWGDDCEMWRGWVPVLIAFDDPKISAAQAKFSRALLSQDHMKDGYTSRVHDVEHTAEDSSDAMTPMMHLELDNPEWSQRALRLAELFETLWTDTNERGTRQFKSTYFSVDTVDPDPRKACDTVYHPRALQPTLLYWQRTGDPRLGRLVSEWMDTWVDAAARAERGKPAGIIPSAVHWPEGFVGGQGENWWDPENHTRDPLYRWPSAMSYMTHTLMLTHFMTGEAKYLEPVRSMAGARMRYLANPPASPEPGTEAWCAAKLGHLSAVAAKYRFATGKHDLDALLEADSNDYTKFRLTGERVKLTRALRNTAQAFRVNFPGYTSEVRYTDRLQRFPRMYGDNGMFPKAIPGIREPSPTLLYSTATGDPGSVGYFPLNAVRWLTPPRDLAVLVNDSGTQRFEAELFHFGEEERSFEAEFYLLARSDTGAYTYTIIADGETLHSGLCTETGTGYRVPVHLPPRKLCTLNVERVYRSYP
jgi:hypothetical protein